MKNEISVGRSTMGVKKFDGERCHICRSSSDTNTVRINLDGIWTVLGEQCQAKLKWMLNQPLEDDDA